MTGKPSRIRERARNRNQQMPTRPLTLKTEISAFPQLEEIAVTLAMNVQYPRKETSFVNLASNPCKSRPVSANFHGARNHEEPMPV